MLTQERLKELLHYDPETGHFTRCAARSGGGPAGSFAGTLDNTGYIRIEINRRRYQAHQLAFLYMTGAFPPAFVDHINRDPADNRWANLRPATPRENGANRGINRNNTSGHRGVSWVARLNKWQVQGTLGRRKVYVGVFESLDEAAAASRAWREANFGEFAAA